MRGLWLLAIAGCAEPGTPFFARGGVTFQNRTVYMGPTRMDFGSIATPLPTGFFLSDQNPEVQVLRARDTCVPSLAGVQLYPVVTAVGDDPKGLQGALEVLMPGPAVLRLKATYEIPYTCGTASTKLTGTSTFTFFPDARIIRSDENLVGTTENLSTSAACSCSGTADPFSFTSFWAFERGEVYDETFAKKTVFDAPACIVIDKRFTLGIKYDGQRTSAGDATGYPIVGQEMSMQMQSWPANHPPQSAKSHVGVVTGETAASCAEALAKLDDGRLAVDVASERLYAKDGIYEATARAYRTPTEVRVPVNHPGFALAIDLGGAKHARVRLGNDVSDNYLVQEFGEYVLFFFNGLDAGNALTIEPLY